MGQNHPLVFFARLVGFGVARCWGSNWAAFGSAKKIPPDFGNGSASFSLPEA